MAQVVVRVLASADPSLRNVFDNFRSLSKRASDAVKRENASATKEKTKGYEADLRAFEKAEATKTKTALREAAKQTKTIESEQKKRTAIATREEKVRVRDAERSHKTFVREVSQGYNRIQTVAGNAFRTRCPKTPRFLGPFLEVSRETAGGGSEDRARPTPRKESDIRK